MGLIEETEILSSIVNRDFLQLLTTFELSLLVELVEVKSEVEEADVVVSSLLLLLVLHDFEELFEGLLIILPDRVERLECFGWDLKRVGIDVHAFRGFTVIVTHAVGVV